MLVLERKKHETIHIGNTTVMVVSIRGDKVRLGIKAPREVNIVRGELIDRDAAELMAAETDM